MADNAFSPGSTGGRQSRSLQKRQYSRLQRLLDWPASIGAVAGLLLLPGAARLAGRRRTALDGIVTLEDALEHCRWIELRGWELVGYVQRLVARKFSIYTVWNLWDAPDHAFAYGMGYCSQYNLALKYLLERLGFKVQAVSSRRVAVSDEPEWNLGHTWLRVTVDGETRDVCAGRVTNTPGHVNFVPVSRPRPGSELYFLFTHLGMMGFVGVMGWKALLTGQAPPAWTYFVKP